MRLGLIKTFPNIYLSTHKINQLTLGNGGLIIRNLAIRLGQLLKRYPCLVINNFIRTLHYISVTFKGSPCNGMIHHRVFHCLPHKSDDTTFCRTYRTSTPDLSLDLLCHHTSLHKCCTNSLFSLFSSSFQVVSPSLAP